MTSRWIKEGRREEQTTGKKGEGGRKK